MHNWLCLQSIFSLLHISILREAYKNLEEITIFTPLNFLLTYFFFTCMLIFSHANATISSKIVQNAWMYRFSEEKYTVAQSICTHYSSLSGQPDIFLGSGTLKKGSKMWVAKSRVQKRGSLLFKKRKDSLASSLFE